MTQDTAPQPQTPTAGQQGTSPLLVTSLICGIIACIMLIPFGWYAGLSGSNMMTGTKTATNPFTDGLALIAMLGVLLPNIGATIGTITALRRGDGPGSLMGIIALTFCVIADVLLVLALITLATGR